MVTQTVRTRIAACAVLLAAAGTMAMAQGATASKPAEKPIIPLKVTLTLTRYDGDKKIENLPFSFLVNANGGQLNSNNAAQVPVPDSTGSVPGSLAAGPGSFTYKPIGTNLTLSAETLDDGRFSVAVSISDSSSSPTKNATPLPLFRSFSITNKVVLRDGQTAEFASSTDKVTGEVTKAVVTLAVVK